MTDVPFPILVGTNTPSMIGRANIIGDSAEESTLPPTEDCREIK
jgi:hypothetical protein